MGFTDHWQGTIKLAPHGPDHLYAATGPIRRSDKTHDSHQRWVSRVRNAARNCHILIDQHVSRVANAKTVVGNHNAHARVISVVRMSESIGYSLIHRLGNWVSASMAHARAIR